MYRALRMAESVHRFNVDDIPIYVSVPSGNLDDFRKCFGNIPCTFLTDEEILEKVFAVHGNLPKFFPPHLMQQLIKLEFWRMGYCKNYAWIDSDSYFIKDFRLVDFFYDEETPYLVQDEYIPEDEDLRMKHVPEKVRQRRIQDIVNLTNKFRALFNNTGPFYAFGGSTPIVWSCMVLESFYHDYLRPQNKSLFEMLYNYPCETQLYGEYAHFCKVIPVKGIRHMFKSYYHADDFYISQMAGEYEYSLAREYFGICMQSNWAKIKEKKKIVPRLKKHLNEFCESVGLLRFEKK